MNKKTVIFGAGQIGRGFIGDICAAEGYFLVFVDVVPEVINLLNKMGHYPLWILGEEKREKSINHLKAYHLSEKGNILFELMDVSLVFTAVGANNLVSLSPLLAAHIEQRVREKPNSYLDIVICENLLQSATVLRQSIEIHLTGPARQYLQTNVGLVETVVSRMVAPLSEEQRKIQPLLVTVEPYCVLPVSRLSFKGGVPAIKAFYPVDNLVPYEELKLYGHNLTHAALAFLGWQKGYRFIWEAMEDESIAQIVSGVRKEASEALIRAHRFARAEVESYFDDLFARFKNRLLADTVTRVGRDPWRKLGPKERIVGAINLCLNQGIFPDSICLVAGACLCYNETEDTQAQRVQSFLKEKGLDIFLTEVCGLEDRRVREKIKVAYQEMKNEGGHSEKR
ncbi:MAG: hypothetical protein NC911_07710 [Candidatus Omnitrophica bacterium]|nr:hypothetical protein [Candidatus Omnitrophota bacterium]